MTEIMMNAKVTKKYETFICIKDDEFDMKATVNEFLKNGYSTVVEKEDDGNIIIVIGKIE